MYIHVIIISLYIYKGEREHVKYFGNNNNVQLWQYMYNTLLFTCQGLVIIHAATLKQWSSDIPRSYYWITFLNPKILEITNIGKFCYNREDKKIN